MATSPDAFHHGPPDLPDLEGAAAEEILSWAVGEFYPDITVACSMQDAVVVDLALRVEPRIEVFFLQTGFHFPETLETARALRERYGRDVVELRPKGEDPAVYWRDGYDACCAARKVTPAAEYLSTKRAWVTGVRRGESPARARAQAVEWDPRGLVKVNPIVAWSDEEVARYIAEHDVIVNPLRSCGYDSIGCWPCTRRGSGRDGRWGGTGKTECGLHHAEPSSGRRRRTGAGEDRADAGGPA